jgi:hypothetical protein
MEGFGRHLNYANVVASLALVIAVAGSTTAIAVSKGAKNNDVNKKGNIRAGHVTTPKLSDGAVTSLKLADGNVTAADLAGSHLVEVTGTALATATCAAGERLLSGGAVPLTGGQPIATSFPNEGGNGWSASAAGGVKVIALCLKATSGG